MQRDPFEETLAPPRKWGSWTDAERSAPPAEQPDYLGSIPAADWKPRKRRKDQRKREKSRWIPLRRPTKKALEKRATALGVPAWELVRYLLEYGLAAVQSGDLELIPQLEPAGLTLYPAEQRTRQRRRKQHDLVNASYRGIPDATWENVKALAQSFPVWQVANKLIEYGLEQMDAGRLQPQPKNIGVRTLY